MLVGNHHAECCLGISREVWAPADILRDDHLSRGEKVRLLEQWRDDKKAYMRASEEGMPGEDRADLLKQIKKALLSLQENVPGDDTAAIHSMKP
jgi:hypothetical protein